MGDALTSAAISVSDRARTQAPERELSEQEIEDIRSAGRTLTEACLAKRLTLIGRATTSDGVGDPTEIPSQYFSAAVQIDPIANAITADGSADFATFERNVNNLTRWEDVVAPTDAVRELSGGGQRDELKKREQQIRAIEQAAKQLSFDPLSIPDGGKGKIKEVCERDPKIFPGKTSFEHAWKCASKCKRVRVVNYERHIPLALR